MRSFSAFFFLAASASGTLANYLPPRPEYKNTASYGRWLAHVSDFAAVSTHHAGKTGVFGNVVSIADGEGPADSHGIYYTYLPSLDATYKDLMDDPRVALSWSEMSLASGRSGGCLNSTAEQPTCGRLTITGNLTKVPKEDIEKAKRFLFATHPVMKGWEAAHVFEPFWMDPKSITEIFIIDMFGGSVPVTVDEFLAADWYRKDMPSGEVCTVCGHVYDAAKDGGGKPFDELPDDWSCPVCGASKSQYKKQADGTWVHLPASQEVCSVCGHVYDAAKDGGGKPFEELPDSWKCPVCGASKSQYKKQADGTWVHLPASQEVCSVCGHVYDAAKDGGGKPFEQLPDSWKCPVCGASKSQYKKQADGTWVHEHDAHEVVV